MAAALSGHQSVPSWVRGAALASAAVTMIGCVGLVESGPAGSRPSIEPAPSGVTRPLQPGPAGLRTLTPSQYAVSVRTVLGLAAHDPVPVSAVGQWATSIGAARGGFSPTTVEAYERAAREIARRVMSDPARRDVVIGCTPAAANSDPCVRSTVARIGRRAYRRTLRDEEIERWSGVATTVGASLGDPWVGLEHALAGILQSPHFLYRVELGENVASDEEPTRLRYSGTELATRIAFLLWSSTPDDALLDEAEDGSLLDDETLDATIERMLADPRAEQGMDAFFADLLDVDALRELEKDPMVFPGFEAMHASLAPQLVRTARVSVLEGGLDALFTSRTTFVDAALAPLYGLDPAATSDELTRLDLDDASPRGGILTTPGLLAMHAYPGKTSVALRGLFVRRRLLCQSIPPPPADVDTQLPVVGEGMLVTTRELVSLHQREASCAGCHRFMDPIGLALEHFDADGSHRLTENGLEIDPSGELDGVPFDDAHGLARALGAHESYPSCIASQLFAFAAGTTVDATHPEMERLADVSADDLRAMLRELARSTAFRYAWPASDAEGGSR